LKINHKYQGKDQGYSKHALAESRGYEF